MAEFQIKDDNSNTKLCKFCKSEIHKKASVCPHCGRKQLSFLRFFSIFMLSGIILMLSFSIIISIFSGALDKSLTAANETVNNIDASDIYDNIIEEMTHGKLSLEAEITQTEETYIIIFKDIIKINE